MAILQCEEMQPAIIEEGTHLLMTFQNIDDRLWWHLNHHRQVQRLMHKLVTIMDRLPWQARAQDAAIALHHADAANHIVDQLVSTPECRWRYGRAVILQVDPACENDRRRQDQFQRGEVIVSLPVISVQEYPSLQVCT